MQSRKKAGREQEEEKVGAFMKRHWMVELVRSICACRRRGRRKEGVCPHLAFLSFFCISPSIRANWSEACPFHGMLNLHLLGADEQGRDDMASYRLSVDLSRLP
jgi:hypothetical protein